MDGLEHFDFLYTNIRGSILRRRAWRRVNRRTRSLLQNLHCEVCDQSNYSMHDCQNKILPGDNVLLSCLETATEKEGEVRKSCR